jgi:hypothetical protein
MRPPRKTGLVRRDRAINHQQHLHDFDPLVCEISDVLTDNYRTDLCFATDPCGRHDEPTLFKVD